MHHWEMQQTSTEMPDYLAPTSLDEALDIKRQMGARARVIAGGTDLILAMRNGRHRPDLLLDLRKLSLNKISSDGLRIRLGAYLSLAGMLENSELQHSFSALIEACRQFAGPPIRNRATLGGNLANASPAADMAPPLMAYDAGIALCSSAGERVIPLTEFFTGPGKTVMRPDEILTEILLPPPPESDAASFIKLGQRRSMAIAIVNLCTRISLDVTGVVKTARIVLGSVAATPIRAIEAESLLTGSALTDDLIDRAGAKAKKEASPITDIRASEQYRGEMVQVLVSRTLRMNRDKLGKDCNV